MGGVVYDENEIGLQRKKCKITPLERVHNDSPLVHNRTYKLLGLYLDEHLSFDNHCDHVCSKIAQSNYIINRSKHFLPSKSVVTLYYALVQSHLSYCLPLYSCTSAKNIAKLERIQKKKLLESSQILLTQLTLHHCLLNLKLCHLNILSTILKAY